MCLNRKFVRTKCELRVRLPIQKTTSKLSQITETRERTFLFKVDAIYCHLPLQTYNTCVSYNRI